MATQPIPGLPTDEPRGPGRLRRAVTTTAATVAACAAAAVLAPAAQAGAYTVAYTGGDGVALRFAPTAGDQISPLTWWTDGTPVAIVCQTWSADGVGPRANHVFDRVANAGRPAATWIPDAYVAGTAPANQFTGGIPRCDATAPAPAGPATPPASGAGERAIAWMSGQLGSRRFDGLCLGAVYQAYLAGGRDITAGLPYGPAHDSAYTYWTVARDRHVGDRNPPRGALVFFRSAAGAPGHVAISLGGGQMISTYDGRTAGIHIMAISAYDPSRYLGWTTA